MFDKKISIIDGDGGRRPNPTEVERERREYDRLKVLWSHKMEVRGTVRVQEEGMKQAKILLEKYGTNAERYALYHLVGSSSLDEKKNRFF